MFGHKRNEDLYVWQERFVRARDEYAGEVARMEARRRLYNGDKGIVGSVEAGGRVKGASNVRNIVFELIESQVDSTIPMPKVVARDGANEDRARMIEDMLRGELDRLPFEFLNDEDERTTPMQGGDFFLVEWDNSKRKHGVVGELGVRLIHPRQLVPQRGIMSFKQGDYVFIQLAQTKDYIRRRYGVDVDDELEERPEIRGSEQSVSEEMVTQVVCYYWNEAGGVGVFSWVNDVVLEDIGDYQARRLQYCRMCDATVPVGDEVCPFCGGKRLTFRSEEYEVLDEDIVLYDGEGREYKRIPAFSGVGGAMGLMGYGEEPMMERTRIPFYRPNVMPIVLRKNVSIDGQLLGNSDVDFMGDQQNAIKKYATKIEEKLFRGGSIVTLPVGVEIEASDEEMKIVRLKDPSQKALIDSFPLQPNIVNDQNLLEANYQWARQTIGITDSFQGRRDGTATSGKAKEFAAAQTAGRFESKRRMKQAAYAELFEVMFKFMLAYADEPRSYRMKDKLGRDSYRVFNRYEFLEMDEAGEWFWNDDFLFSTDTSGTLAQNREAMWQETRMNFEKGTFGNPQDLDTMLMFWGMMEGLHYPLAGQVLANLEQKKEEQAEMMAQQQRMVEQQMMMGMAQPGMGREGLGL